MMRFEFSRYDFLADAMPTLLVSGLEPAQRVTLAVELTDANTLVWRSEAEYRADANGTVDVGRDFAVGAHYQGVDAKGLFWSMSPVPPSQNLDYVRRLADDVPTYEYPVFAQEDIREFHVLAAAGGQECSTTLRQHFLADGVVAEDVRTDDGLRGRLYRPVGIPRGAVICLTGSGGGVDQDFAPLFASHGYLAFALAYFAYDDLPEVLADIPLEYFAKGAEWLSNQAGGMKVVVLGTSRGSEAAQLTAIHFPDHIAAIIARVPSFVANAAARDGKTYKDPTWLKNGRALDYVSVDLQNLRPMSQTHDLPLMDVGEVYRRCWAALPDDHPAILPVEDIDVPLLLISSPDDALWPSGYAAQAICARLERLNPQAEVEHRSYAGASHRIKAPGTVTTFSWVYYDEGEFDALGGVPAYTARANEQSWRDMLAFVGRANV